MAIWARTQVTTNRISKARGRYIWQHTLSKKHTLEQITSPYLPPVTLSPLSLVAIFLDSLARLRNLHTNVVRLHCYSTRGEVTQLNGTDQGHVCQVTWQTDVGVVVTLINS